MNDMARRMMDRRMNDRRMRDYDMRGRDYARYDSADGRRGVKGTGRYGIGGRMYDGDYMDRADYGSDYADYGDDYGDYSDYGKPRMKLKKRDIKEWEHKLMKADGTKGMYFDTDRAMKAAERVGVHFGEYSEKEFAITMNMLYSDYFEALKDCIPPEKEAMAYAKLAKAWLEDEDAPEASEKLALYYYCIVCADEE